MSQKGHQSNTDTRAYIPRLSLNQHIIIHHEINETIPGDIKEFAMEAGKYWTLYNYFQMLYTVTRFIIDYHSDNKCMEVQ